MELNASIRHGRLQPVTVVSEKEAGALLLRAQASAPGAFLTDHHLLLTERYLVYGKQHLFAKSRFEEMRWIPLHWIRPESVRVKGMIAKEVAFTLADGTQLAFTVNAQAGPSAAEFAGALFSRLSTLG